MDPVKNVLIGHNILLHTGRLNICNVTDQNIPMLHSSFLEPAAHISDKYRNSVHKSFRKNFSQLNSCHALV
jgi:hypothetical protein